MALRQTLPLEYKSLFTPGEEINGKIAGATYDVNGNDDYKARWYSIYFFMHQIAILF